MALRRGRIGGLVWGLEPLLSKLLRRSCEGDACTVILCWKSKKRFKKTFVNLKLKLWPDYFNNLNSRWCSTVVQRTWRQADPVPILEFKAVAAELALPALHVRLFLVELVNDDVELSLQDVDLPLGQLLLAPPQRLLLALLLQRCLGQLLLPRSQLLSFAKEQQRG